jgi:hypothetical protein
MKCTPHLFLWDLENNDKVVYIIWASHFCSFVVTHLTGQPEPWSGCSILQKLVSASQTTHCHNSEDHNLKIHIWLENVGLMWTRLQVEYLHCINCFFFKYISVEQIDSKQDKIYNIGTKCNSLTQQFIGISTPIDTWATFRLYRVIFRPSKTTDPIYTRYSSALWDPQCLYNSILTIRNHI